MAWCSRRALRRRGFHQKEKALSVEELQTKWRQEARKRDRDLSHPEGELGESITIVRLANGWLATSNGLTTHDSTPELALRKLLVRWRARAEPPDRGRLNLLYQSDEGVLCDVE